LTGTCVYAYSGYVKAIVTDPITARNAALPLRLPLLRLARS
jgi:hypothetical protein